VVVLRRRLALALLSALLVAGAYLVSSGHPDLVALATFCVSVVATAIYSTAAAVFRGHGRVRVEAVNEVVSRVFVLALGTWWLYHGGGLRAAVAVYAMADAASAVVLSVLAWRTTAGRRRPVDAGRFAAGRMVPVALATGLGVLYYRVDLWLLALLRGSRDVALYGSTYRVLDGILLGASAIAALSVTATVRAADADRRRVVGRLVGLSVLVTAPIALLGLVGAPQVMRVLFGARYAGAGPLLRLLLIAAVPSAVVTVVAPLAFLWGRSTTVKGYLWFLALDLALNLALIPAMGPAGAALATLFCQVLLALWLWCSVLRWVPAPGAPAVARSGDGEHPLQGDPRPPGHLGIDGDAVHHPALDEVLEAPGEVGGVDPEHGRARADDGVERDHRTVGVLGR
jgi:O-antigen/teichoic acid export membrane protein